MTDEYIDIVSSQNELKGNVELKSIAHTRGLWHRAAHVWVYNSEKEILLQKRSKTKNFYPDIWDFSVGGHVAAGESVELSAVRETKEEIGVSIDASELQYIETRKIINVFQGLLNNEFQYVYVLRKDISIEQMVKQDLEVSELGWFSVEEIVSMKESKELLPHPEGYWEHMIDIIQSKD